LIEQNVEISLDLSPVLAVAVTMFDGTYEEIWVKHAARFVRAFGLKRPLEELRLPDFAALAFPDYDCFAAILDAFAVVYDVRHAEFSHEQLGPLVEMISRGVGVLLEKEPLFQLNPGALNALTALAERNPSAVAPIIPAVVGFANNAFAAEYAVQPWYWANIIACSRFLCGLAASSQVPVADIIQPIAAKVPFAGRGDCRIIVDSLCAAVVSRDEAVVRALAVFLGLRRGSLRLLSLGDVHVQKAVEALGGVLTGEPNPEWFGGVLQALAVPGPARP
jgi:hypothetical protein